MEAEADLSRHLRRQPSLGPTVAISVPNTALLVQHVLSQNRTWSRFPSRRYV